MLISGGGICYNKRCCRQVRAGWVYITQGFSRRSNDGIIEKWQTIKY